MPDIKEIMDEQGKINSQAKAKLIDAIKDLSDTLRKKQEEIVEAAMKAMPKISIPQFPKFEYKSPEINPDLIKGFTSEVDKTNWLIDCIDKNFERASTLEKKLNKMTLWLVIIGTATLGLLIYSVLK